MGRFDGVIRTLATTNLIILILRLVQVFFAGIVLGIMANFIKDQKNNGDSASSPYVFDLVVATASILTQIIYCFNFYHRLVCLWDICLAVGWLLSMFWLLNKENPISCSWSAFNPFGTNSCGQIRGVLISQIVEAVVWFITGAVGVIAIIRANRVSNASKA